MYLRLIVVFFMLVSCSGKAQQLPVPQPHFDYLKSSRQNRTAATLFLVTGTAATVTGLFIWAISPVAGISGTSADVRSAASTGRALTAVGVVFAGISIPLYNTAAKHRRLARLQAGATAQHFNGVGRQPAMGFKLQW